MVMFIYNYILIYTECALCQHHLFLHNASAVSYKVKQNIHSSDQGKGKTKD